MNKIAVTAIGTLLALGVSAAAFGQGLQTKSTLTVTDPVEVPGAILQPGTYVVKVVENTNNRNIVQFTDVAESKVFAAALCTPHVGAAQEPNTTYVYFPNHANGGKALRTWFAPNDRFGQDFVYPHERAVELARVINEPVPAYEATGPVTPEVLKTVEVKPVAAEKTEKTETAPIATTSAPAAPAPVMVAETNLPKTASGYPLLAGLGLLALGGAASLSLIGRRSV